MKRRHVLAAVGSGLCAGIAGCLGPDDQEGDRFEERDAPEDGGGPGRSDEPDDGDDEDERVEETFTVETVADGFTDPWGLAFVPDGSALFVTEIDGELARLDPESGSVEHIDGIPDVHSSGQGGLLDVALHPDWPDQRWLYMTYAVSNGNGESTTKLGRGRFDPDGDTLEDVEELHVAEPFVDSTSHYGSRVAFGTDDMAYMTIGDRGFKDFGPDHVSQDTTNELGATLRLAPDGSIPSDNPFVDDPDVRDAIYSYGHRNAQGMTVHPETGELWQSEHGEEDGDEINIIEAGENYGWPVAAYGCEYGTTEAVGVPPHERDDVVNPVYYWECTSGGFPPAGMTFYDGDAFSGWNGDLFVGNLAGEYLGHFDVDGRDVTELDPLLANRDWRVRDVAVSPADGSLYVAIDDSDAPIVRLEPE